MQRNDATSPVEGAGRRVGGPALALPTEVEIGFLDRPRGPDLFLRRVRPPEPLARLMLLHASLVHSEYYVPFALRLAALGIETWLPDLRGHGRSGGVRGYTRSWDEAVEDAAWAFDAMAKGSDLPCWAGGESYGGLVAYSAIKAGRVQPQACLFLSPAFGIFYRPSPVAWWVLERVGLPVFGRIRPLRALPAAGITEDPAVSRAFERDPLCNRRYTLAFLLRMMVEQRGLRIPDPDWRIPSLVLLSGGDPITDNAVSRSVFARSPQVQVREAEGGLHSLVADKPAWAAAQVADWLGREGVQASWRAAGARRQEP